MRLDRFLNELLFENDCVIIPGLGGIVANQRAAFLNPASHTFNPPSKRLAFNTSLIVNDGLLASHISRREQVTYSEALVLIENWVYQALLELKAGKELVLTGVGRLSLDAEKNLQFQPDSSVNHLISAFGLSPVHSPAIRREASVHQAVPASKATRTRFRAWRIMELIPAAAILALMVFNPAVIQRLNNNIAQVNPFSIPSQTRVETIRPESIAVNDESTVSQTIPESLPEAAVLPEASKPEIATPAPEPEPVPLKEVVSEGSTQAFHVIGGCFKVEQNAVNFRDEALEKGWQASIIGQNPAGLFMVSLAQSESRSGIEEMALEVREEFEPAAWVYQR